MPESCGFAAFTDVLAESTEPGFLYELDAGAVRAGGGWMGQAGQRGPSFLLGDFACQKAEHFNPQQPGCDDVNPYTNRDDNRQLADVVKLAA